MTDVNDQVTSDELEKLNTQLAAFCAEHSIDKFEAEEIVELIEDGEEVAWIIDQLALEETLSAEVSKMLHQIKEIVHPESGELELEAPSEEAAPAVEAAAAPDFSAEDLSQLPLPEGMKLPPGMNMEKLQEMMESPQGSFMADFSLFCQEKGFMPNPKDKSASKEMKEFEEEWMDTPREAFEGKTPREMIAENPELALPKKVETFRRDTPKVGRNDPCPCGSGKKYKKCHGKGK